MHYWVSYLINLQKSNTEVSHKSSSQDRLGSLVVHIFKDSVLQSVKMRDTSAALREEIYAGVKLVLTWKTDILK